MPTALPPPPEPPKPPPPGEIVWNTAMPDGTPRKLLDVSRLTSLGWTAKTKLPEGIRLAYQWFLDHQEDFRG